MADTYNLDAKKIPGVTWTDDGDNTVEDAAVKITNIETPTASDGAATKGYVDTQVAATNELVEDLSPQLGAQLDINGFGLGDGTNALLDFVEDASAVNNIQVENEATGSGPIIRSTGADTNVDLVVETKGTGNIFLNLPTSDPSVAGALWNNAGVVTVSS